MGLEISIGYRWMQAAREAGAPKFARLVVAGPTAQRPPAAIAIEVGGALVHVESGFDSEPCPRGSLRDRSPRRLRGLTSLAWVRALLEPWGRTTQTSMRNY
jgi:hypothetical protein